MKAFLLAGGRGERLRPLTLSTPKCLVRIKGVPLLAYWLDHCAREGVTEILVNVSQHPTQVREFLAARRSVPPRVELLVEAEPRGTAGTVRDNREFVAGQESFWVFYADNLTNVSLAAMSATHRRHTDLATVGLFRAPDPTAAGIVDMDTAGRIVGFEEKPRRPKGNLANAGIYLARQELFDWIPVGPRLVDFGHDVFPGLMGRLHGHVIQEFVMDIGTPEALERAAAAWMQHAT